jgi:hypothetical protein
MNWLTFSTSLTPIGVIELQIWEKYWEEVRLELTGQIYYLTSSSGLDLVWHIMMDDPSWDFEYMCYLSIDIKFSLFGVMRFWFWVVGHWILLMQNWVIGHWFSLTETESCGHLHVDVPNLENILDMYLYVMMRK